MSSQAQSMHAHSIDDNAVVRRALAADKRDGLRLAVRARWASLAVIAVLIVFIGGSWTVIYYHALLAGFALIGWAQLMVGRVGHSRKELALMFCDLALMTFTFVYPNPLETQSMPLAMQFRFAGFLYFYVLLAAATLAYSWRTIVAMGVWTTVLWSLGVAWVALQPPEFPELSVRVHDALGGFEHLYWQLDPNSPQLRIRLEEVVVFLIVAGILGVAGWRSNRLLIRHAGIERERGNLARYFSPNVVDELAHNDDPLKRVRTQDVAVLFVDIFGFTAFAEAKPPQDVIATLRDFFVRMERSVFAHGGTLDKYLGDGLMATFGTPVTGACDATNALRCARRMVDEIGAWNDERRRRGEAPIRVGFGLHYGRAVLGDIGSNRLEFAVIGTTVNIASRLERLCRRLDADIVASDALIRQVGREGGDPDLLAGFVSSPAQVIRGVSHPLDVWKSAKATG